MQVICPECGSSDFDEIGYRYTWQAVEGLAHDGSADNYETFDYGDDVAVIGWSCRECDWSAEGDTQPIQAAFEAAYKQAAATLAALYGAPS